MTAKAIAVVILIVGVLTSCSAPVQEHAPEAPLVWPPEPAAPRVAYVKTFSKPEDLGIAKGLLQRLGDFLFGADESRLVRPMAVVAVDFVLYVADPGARGVHRFDQRTGSYALLRGESGVPLSSPVGLALGRNGEVYVTDSALGKVFVISPQAKFAKPLALKEHLGQPTGIACDPATGRLYVVDTTAHRIVIFNADGTVAARIGTRGTADGEFNYPTLLWRARDGRLYVTDSLNFRIQVLDDLGHFVSKFGKHGDGSGDLARQKGVATDRLGHVYVVDALFHALQIFDEKGRYLLSIGAMGHDRGEFWLPTGIFIADDDTIYVADSHNRRVQVFRYVGGPT